MDCGFIEAIYDCYIRENRIEINLPDEEKFKDKYINPLFEKNEKDGIEMEYMFNQLVTDYNILGFKYGFKACMHYMIECMSSDE